MLGLVNGRTGKQNRDSGNAAIRFVHTPAQHSEPDIVGDALLGGKTTVNHNGLAGYISRGITGKEDGEAV